MSVTFSSQQLTFSINFAYRFVQRLCAACHYGGMEAGEQLLIADTLATLKQLSRSLTDRPRHRI